MCSRAGFSLILLFLVTTFVSNIQASQDYSFDAIGPNGKGALVGDPDPASPFHVITFLVDGCVIVELCHVKMVAGSLYGMGPSVNFCINDKLDSGFITYYCGGKWGTLHFDDVKIRPGGPRKA